MKDFDGALFVVAEIGLWQIGCPDRYQGVFDLRLGKEYLGNPVG
jgi:hypothetical protein